MQLHGSSISAKPQAFPEDESFGHSVPFINSFQLKNVSILDTANLNVFLTTRVWSFLTIRGAEYNAARNVIATIA
jgi:hypothetical protein